MPKNDPPPMLPTRGVPGGWHDPWSDDATSAVRARIETLTRQLTADAEREARLWREELMVRSLWVSDKDDGPFPVRARAVPILVPPIAPMVVEPCGVSLGKDQFPQSASRLSRR